MVLAILIISILSLLVSILSLILVWTYTIDRDATLDKMICDQRGIFEYLIETLNDLKRK